MVGMAVAVARGTATLEQLRLAMKTSYGACKRGGAVLPATAAAVAPRGTRCCSFVVFRTSPPLHSARVHVPHGPPG